jgi:hypothetical protein
MAQQILKKFIGNDQIDGSKILLSNAQFVRAKKLDGSPKDVFQLNASDKIEFSEAPLAAIEGTEASSLQTKNQLDLAVAAEATLRSDADTGLQNQITQEVSDRQAGDAALQSQINANSTNLIWKGSAFLISDDAELRAAAEGDAVSAILPFSDDEAPQITISDILAGMLLIARNGVSSKIMKVYDDAGTLKVTFVGVEALVEFHTYNVKHDLTDSPSDQENQSIWTFNGSEMVKVGDIDFSVATGIDLSGSYAPQTGAILSTDSVEAAIAKNDGNLAQEITDRGTAVSGLQSQITQEISDRQAADSALQSQVTSNANAISQEVSDRTAADTTLQSNIDAEATTRANADTALQSDIDSEVSRAQAAEQGLQTQIDGLTSLDPVEYKGSWNASTNSPALVDGTGDNGDVYHVSAAGSVDFGSGSISFEIGDKVVYNGSIWEKWDMTDAVSSVNGQQGAVVLDADDILMLNGTTSVETKLNGLQSQIDSNDTKLADHETRISNIETAVPAWHKKKIVLAAQDITNGYVDLDHVAVAGSISSFVDRLAMHEGDDFTLSEVASKTRITFAGDLASAGDQALESGDSLYFKYQY